MTERSTPALIRRVGVRRGLGSPHATGRMPGT